MSLCLLEAVENCRRNLLDSDNFSKTLTVPPTTTTVTSTENHVDSDVDVKRDLKKSKTIRSKLCFFFEPKSPAPSRVVVSEIVNLDSTFMTIDSIFSDGSSKDDVWEVIDFVDADDGSAAGAADAAAADASADAAAADASAADAAGAADAAATNKSFFYVGTPIEGTTPIEEKDIHEEEKFGNVNGPAIFPTTLQGRIAWLSPRDLLTTSSEKQPEQQKHQQQQQQQQKKSLHARNLASSLKNVVSETRDSDQPTFCCNENFVWQLEKKLKPDLQETTFDNQEKMVLETTCKTVTVVGENSDRCVEEGVVLAKKEDEQVLAKDLAQDLAQDLAKELAKVLARKEEDDKQEKMDEEEEKDKQCPCYPPPPLPPPPLPPFPLFCHSKNRVVFSAPPPVPPRKTKQIISHNNPMINNFHQSQPNQEGKVQF